ncbi:long-chain-fatty-acid--CoA ligase 1a isoform X6 [Phyllopteryx taeniolatus]|uniref:long-chain-fatty-acid--CoA ligase 1a isoform X6 n=1 Tax=Phyllopteryx taeniolatus TaxID=161469 RepID=UPI002AD2BD4B|nr:long-chain-fatty-acid--CoA ligase 1a isoform X6 [Phyllopteryx taeniolatus]
MRSIACSTAMQGQEVLRQLRLPELDDLRQYIRGLPTNTLLGMGAIAAFTTYWLSTRPRALEPPCDLTMQSVDMLGEEGARRSALNKSDEHMTYYHSDAKTIYEAFLRGLRVSNNGPCLGARKPNRPYEWQSYREVADRAENVGSALLHKGHAQSGDKFIGIFAQNRPEWTISELACYTYSLVAVPLYDTLGAEAISYIIDKVSISTVICDVPEKARMILDCFAEKERTVKTIVVMEPFDGELVARGQTCGVEVLSLKEFEDLGKANYRDPMPPKAEDLALICFTSGTTGNPKGAVLTHGNIIANTAAFLKITEGKMQATSKDVHISFLPLAHMLERVVQVCHAPSLTTPCACVLCVCPLQVHCMLDCRDVLVSYLPLAHMLERVVQFYEGYGQTECTAGCSMSMPGDWTAGHVGPPLPCNAIKLVDVVDMNYLAANNEGEVCVKGPNVFLGYLGNPEKTAEAIDKDGWLHTGDIGKWLPNGTLKIIDRKKHIFKLAQGEYIAPEKIENIYNRSDPVAQIFVHGDSLQACLVGIVVPDPDFLPIWIKKRGINGSYLDMCKSNDVKNAILEDIQKLGKEAGLKSFEQVRDIALHPEMFSVQNGLLTPTLKAKRAELLSHFRAQIDELYAGVKV